VKSNGHDELMVELVEQMKGMKMKNKADKNRVFGILVGCYLLLITPKCMFYMGIGLSDINILVW